MIVGLEKKCKICGIGVNEFVNIRTGYSVSVIMKHHVKMKKDGGTFKDGFLYLCEVHHRKIHTIDDKLNWKQINKTVTEEYLSKGV
jgi:predicted restriction endonuclease